jgi:phosphoglycolate phosphatase
LESLKAQGHALAIATNAYRVSALESLSHLEIHHLFDAIACYDDVPHGKPHPDMLHKILEELSMESHHAIFVGDGMRDQMASEKANIPYMMVDWGFTEHQNAIRSVEALRVLLLG